MTDNISNTVTTIPLGIIVERKDASNKWVDNVWTVIDIMPGASQVDQWMKLDEGEGWERYHAATLELELFKGETEGYRYNLSQDTPSVYVVLRPGEEIEDEEVEPFLATVCPYEAMKYSESGDEIIEGVPMPASLLSWVQGFVDAYHVDEPFKKRRNKKHNSEEARHGPRPGLVR